LPVRAPAAVFRETAPDLIERGAVADLVERRFPAVREVAAPDLVDAPVLADAPALADAPDLGDLAGDTRPDSTEDRAALLLARLRMSSVAIGRSFPAGLRCAIVVASGPMLG
jgi:hypothetical protein